ncbi:hypothetical protein SAMN05421748_14044 [Paractinoplanes atraurantiacus]|uniref:Uncharacterized protein n=2 Tax=Paractinoplanes atraurantiacus TaxID=1036182 RepID=A0A285KHW9_9ACTN|nr:hypothetical protein SAMN05421748_14044 [Actinoplanes atraurantiacus]
MRAAPSARWCAAAASGYSLAAGLVLLRADTSETAFFGSVAGTFLVLTLLPQPFRRHTSFRADCRIAVVLSVLAQFLVFFFGGCLFLPTIAMLVLAALRPPRAASVAPDPRSWRERWEITVRRAIAGSAIAGLLLYIAAVTR